MPLVENKMLASRSKDTGDGMAKRAVSTLQARRLYNDYRLEGGDLPFPKWAEQNGYTIVGGSR